MKKEFNPTRIEVVEPHVKDEHNPIRVRLFCLCGDITVYNQNQQKRIAYWKEQHGKYCNKENLIEFHSGRIDRYRRKINESESIMKDIEAGKYGE